MKKSYIEFTAWAAIILVVIVIGRWAFSVDTHAQEGGELGQGWVLYTPTPEVKKKREIPPDCTRPGFSGYPECWTSTPTEAPPPTETPIPPPTATPVPPTPTPVPPTPVPTLTHNEIIATAVAGDRETRIARQRETATARATARAETAVAETATAQAISAEQTAAAKTATAAAKPGPGPGPGPGPNPPTPTYTPTPTPRPSTPASVPPFVAEALIAQRWHIFNPGVIDINIRLNPHPNAPTAQISDYQFSVKVNPDTTGMYISEDWKKSDCEPGNEGDEQSGWYKSSSFRIKVVRCSLGTLTNEGFEVIAKLRPPASPAPEVALAPTGRIKQAWHQSDRLVHYTLITSPAISGTVPALVPASNFSKTDFSIGLTNAVTALNKAIRKETGREVFYPAVDGEVTIKAYWDGYSEGCKRPIALGCHEHRWTYGGYPHMGISTILIQYPPALYDNSTPTALVWADWTISITEIKEAEALGHGTSKYYLPAAILHELGHTLGVEHVPEDPNNESHHKMDPGYDAPSYDMDLSNSDLNGMVNALNDHH